MRIISYPSFNTLEPKHRGYVELKKGIKKFVDRMDRKVYTYVIYPKKDSLVIYKKFTKGCRKAGI